MLFGCLYIIFALWQEHKTPLNHFDRHKQTCRRSKLAAMALYFMLSKKKTMKQTIKKTQQSAKQSHPYATIFNKKGLLRVL